MWIGDPSKLSVTDKGKQHSFIFSSVKKGRRPKKKCRIDFLFLKKCLWWFLIFTTSSKEKGSREVVDKGEQVRGKFASSPKTKV
jgi:hypothetical protein